MIGTKIIELVAYAAAPHPDGAVVKFSADSGVTNTAAGVSSIIDSISGVVLTQPTAANRPSMETDTRLNLNYIHFDDQKSDNLNDAAVSIAGWSSANNKKMTVLFVLTANKLNNQMAFSSRSATATNLLELYLPYSNSKVYFDCANVTTGRTESGAISNPNNTVNAFLFEKNGNTVKIFQNGALIKTNAASTPDVPTATQPMSLGSRADATTPTQFMNMDFYEMQVYDKTLSAADKVKLWKYVDRKYQIHSIPVEDYVATFLPKDTVVWKNAINRSFVTSLTDPISKDVLAQRADNERPELVVDASGRQLIRFDAADRSSLVGTGINIDKWASTTGAQSGKQLTFIFIAKSVTGGQHFQWSKRNSPTALDNNQVFRAYMPWSDKRIYIDYKDSSAGGRTQSAVTATSTGQINAYLYERNGATANLYMNGANIKTQALTTSLTSGSTGDLILGAGLNAAGAVNYVSMDFYGVFIYNRALTAGEKAKVFAWTKQVYGV